MAAGAQYIVSYFDENSSDDSRWHTGHEFMRENFRFLLQKVLDHSWFGLIIKPKYPSSLHRRLGWVVDLLERAQATGRCHVFTTGGMQHGTSTPAEAALSSDLAIHGHLCAGTAGFEAALAGVPTLLLDREGWEISPLYRLGVGRVVFQNWEDLWETMCKHRNDPASVPGFGDWSPLLPEMDPFRDGGAAERMGAYLTWIHDGLKAGNDRATVLADAAERYTAQWGAAMITPVNVAT
jgi:hypothetical protein